MDVNVPEKLSRLPFSSDPRSNLAAGGSKQFDRDTVFFFKVQSEGVTHASGHVRNHRYLAFFLRGSEGAFPVGPDAPRVEAKKCHYYESFDHRNRAVHHGTSHAIDYFRRDPVLKGLTDRVNPGFRFRYHYSSGGESILAHLHPVKASQRPPR